MNKEKVAQILDQFPVLEIVLQGGVLSIKMVREMLDVDRWYMQDLYKELILARAVVGVTNSTFKASTELLQFIQERKQHEDSSNQASNL